MLAIFKKKQQPAPIQELPQRELINTCSKCSMEKFVDCIVNGNTHVVDDWGAIFNEYLTISGDTHISSILELLKSITIAENKLWLIEVCVQQFAGHYHGYIADELKGMGFNFQYEEGENLNSELNATITKSKQILIQLKQDKAELEELRAAQGEAATVQDYELQYSAIEEFKGTPIDPTIYKVSRYVADVQRMKERYKPNKVA